MSGDVNAVVPGARRRGAVPLLVALPLLSNIASFILFAPLFGPGVSPTAADFQRAATLMAVALLSIELLGLLWVASNAHAEGTSLRALANFRRERWRAYLTAGVIALPFTLLAGWLYVVAQAAAGVDASPAHMSPPEAALWYGAIPIAAPLVEETIWRGYAIPRLKGAWRSLLLAGFSFAAFHGIVNPLGLAATLLQALAWGWTYRRTGSTVPGIALHFLSRYLALVPGFS